MATRAIQFIVLTIAIVAMTGCTQLGLDAVLNPEEPSAPAPAEITESEALDIWDSLAGAVGGDGYATMKKRRPLVRAATLEHIDLVAVAKADFDTYIARRRKAEGFFPIKHEFSVADHLEGLGDGSVAEEILDTTSAELFDEGWSLGVDWRLYRGQLDDTATARQMVGHEYLLDLLMPAAVPRREISVEGTNTIVVTFPDGKTGGEWTERYVVDKREGEWVIVRAPDLGNYWLRSTSSPRVAEVKRAFKNEKGNRLKGTVQDRAGRWWVLVARRGDVAQKVHLRVGMREVDNSWRVSRSIVSTGQIEVEEFDLEVPDEVRLYLEDISLNDMWKQEEAPPAIEN